MSYKCVTECSPPDAVRGPKSDSCEGTFLQRPSALLQGRARVCGLVHATGHAREQGDRGAGGHQRLHHRPLLGHEDHRGGRQVSWSNCLHAFKFQTI